MNHARTQDDLRDISWLLNIIRDNVTEKPALRRAAQDIQNGGQLHTLPAAWSYRLL